MSDLCLKNEAYTVYSALVCSRGLCRIFAYRTRYTQCVVRLFLRVAYVGSLFIERGIHSVQRACFFAWLVSDLCLQNKVYTVCSALVPSRGLCRIFAYRTRHKQCVARLFVLVAYVRSLLIERSIHSVQRACSFAWLMSDLCLQNEAYTVCSALVPPHGLCRIFAYRTRHTLCVVHLFLRAAYVGSLLIERGIHSVLCTCSFAWLMSDLCLKNNECD